MVGHNQTRLPVDAVEHGSVSSDRHKDFFMIYSSSMTNRAVHSNSMPTADTVAATLARAPFQCPGGTQLSISTRHIWVVIMYEIIAQRSKPRAGAEAETVAPLHPLSAAAAIDSGIDSDRDRLARDGQSRWDLPILVGQRFTGLGTSMASGPRRASPGSPGKSVGPRRRRQVPGLPRTQSPVSAAYS